jgi:hypothetical protein
MGWSRDVDKRLRQAVRDGNVDECRNILREFPDNRRGRDGRDFFLWMAISNNHIDLVRFFVEEVGIGPDEKMDPMFSTPLLQALQDGKREIAFWLIEHGASVNEGSGDTLDSPALKFAVFKNDLEIVQRLVERGADVNATGQSWANAYMLAEDPAIRKYLESVGGRVVVRKKVITPDYAASHARLLTIVEEHADEDHEWGRRIKWTKAFPGDPTIVFCARGVAPGGKNVLLFTLGMSDVSLTDPEASQPLGIELVAYLPANWRFDNKTNADPQWNWPMNVLEKLARQIIANRTLHVPHVLIEWNGDPPQPLTPETKLCAWLLLPTREATMPDGRDVCIYSAVPLYREELEFVRECGDEQLLLKRLEWLQIPREWDLNRPNAVADWPDLDDEGCNT